MAGLGREHRTVQRKKNSLPGFIQDCAVIAAFSVAALTTGANALDLNDLPSVGKPDKPGKYTIDTSKCSVTDQTVRLWIGNNGLTVALSKAYKDISDGWPGLTDDKFGHSRSKNIIGTKADALRMINEHRKQLYNMAAKIAANQNPACDSCQLLNNWGKVKYIATISRKNKIGSRDISKLTQHQMGDPKVAKELNDYIALNELRVNSYPDNADLFEQTKLDNQCLAEIKTKIDNLSVVDESQCNRAFIDKLLGKQLANIGQKLDDSYNGRTASQRKADKDVKSLLSVQCVSVPGTQTYRYMGFARSR